MSYFAANGHVRFESRHFELLLVEPDVTGATVIREALKDAGLNMHVSVVAGDEALEFLRGENGYHHPPVPDLIILNSGLDGPSLLLLEIRSNQRLKDSVVIVVSGSRRLEDMQEAAACGANCFIDRPNELSGIVNLLRACCDAGTSFVKLTSGAAL